MLHDIQYRMRHERGSDDLEQEAGIEWVALSDRYKRLE